MIYSAQTDDRLVRLAGEGDRSAFAEIFQRYHQQLYRYCQGLLDSQDDARDALQGAMEQAWRSAAKQSVRGGLRAWLYRIAHNEAISVIRIRDRYSAIGAEVDELQPVGDAAVEAAQREQIRELVADLRLLPDRQRGALLMRELSGLDYDQVAAALSVSPAAARQAVYEARMALHSLEEGRAMDCQEVRRRISDADGRAIRGRKLRAHLTACAGCRSFQEAISIRPARLALALPVLPAATATSMLSSLAGPGAGGGGSTGGGGVVQRDDRRLAGLFGAAAVVAAILFIMWGDTPLTTGDPQARDTARAVPHAGSPAASKRREPPRRRRATPPVPSPGPMSSLSAYTSATPSSVIAADQSGPGDAGRRAADGGGGSGLPFTGMDLGILALVGLSLTGLGVLLRRLSAPPRQPG